MDKRFCLTMIPIWFLIGASAQKVEVTENKKADFGRYKTFFIRDGDVVLVTRSDANEGQMKTRLREAILIELKKKGYEPVTDSTADLSVSFVAEIVERTEQENLGPLGETPARTGADLDQPRTWTQEVRNGSLVIEVFEGKTNKSVWRSRSEINFRSSDLNEVLSAGVGRSLRKFPKRGK
jgi:hypothetical protein